MASTTRPNIVLMVSDDHGLDAGCYGSGTARTPNMDALAGEGVRFTSAFCTSASCAASRSVILTGQHNHANGAYGHTHGRHHFRSFEDTRTLPAMLNEAGYRTGRVGKTHYAPESIYPFETHIGHESYQPRDDIGMSEACRAFIEAEDERPFFLYWASHNPHRAWVREDHPLKPNDFGNPVESFPGDEEQFYDEATVTLPPYLSDTPEVRAEWAQYCQSVSRLDRGIGRLIQILKETGEYDNTLILYISDNGAAFPEAKTTQYEAGINLPCIVKPAGEHKAGLVSDALVTWTDITPTCLDAAAFDTAGETLHGKSLLPILGTEGDPPGWREEVYTAHTFHEITNYYPMRTVRTQRYKFIWNIAHPLTYSFASDLYRSISWQGALRDRLERFGQRTVEAYLHRPRFELYDLQADPNETENLAGQPEHAELVKTFCEKLKTFQEETSDPWLHKWEYE
jgi:N-sulfoglucosamine sulfohydrolase